MNSENPLPKSNREYELETTMRRVKVAVVGNRGVGKTSLIRSMVGEPQPEKYLKTLSDDVKSKTRRVGNMQVQYNIWDTVSRSPSSIFLEGHDTSFRNSDVQVIVHRQSETQTMQKLQSLAQFIIEYTQKPSLLIVNNVEEGSQEASSDKIKQHCKQKGWEYIRMNCTDLQQAVRLWKKLDQALFSIRDSLDLKHNNNVVIKSKPYASVQGSRCVIKWPKCW